MLQNNNVIGIYANTRGMNGIQTTCGNPINRTSLMSTGSSEEGTSSGSASCGESSQISSSMEQAVENGGNIDFDVSNTYFGPNENSDLPYHDSYMIYFRTLACKISRLAFATLN